MATVALDILTRSGKQFLLVVEEEGTDNFGNSNNAAGTLEALSRADDAIGVALEYIEQHPNTTLVTAADSDAGGMAVHPVSETGEESHTLPPTARNGAPFDGVDGAESVPFLAQPDQFGNRMYFGISWAGNADVAGGVIARAHGLNAELLPVNVDNTDVYRMMYATLFGVWLEIEE
jgi:alkaline phosphatase